MEKNSRPFLLILFLLTVFSAFLSVNYKISKVEKYSESIDSGLADLQSQHNTLWGDVVSESELRVAQIGQLQRENENLKKLLGIDGRYDTNNVLVKPEDLEKFLSYKVYAVYLIAFKIKSRDRNEVEIVIPPVEAPAIVIGRYVLMASHTNDPDVIKWKYFSRQLPSGETETLDAKLFRQTIILPVDDKTFELTEIYRNKEKDFSLFELPIENAVPNFPIVFGKSDELKVGNFIYINGKPRNTYEVARPGYVSSLYIVYDGDSDKKETHNFNVSQTVLPGDSGSPVIAFRDGKPELVGMVEGYIDGDGNTIRAYAFKINVAINEIREKLGIDLRGLQHQILSK